MLPVNAAGGGAGMEAIALPNAGVVAVESAGARAPDDSDAGLDPAVTELLADNGGMPVMQAGSGGASGSAGMPATCSGNFDPASLPKRLPLTGDLAASDPALIERDGSCYVSSTGSGIAIKHSSDLIGDDLIALAKRPDAGGAIVGRARSLAGPYLDRAGKPMLDEGWPVSAGP